MATSSSLAEAAVKNDFIWSSRNQEPDTIIIVVCWWLPAPSYNLREYTSLVFIEMSREQKLTGLGEEKREERGGGGELPIPYFCMFNGQLDSYLVSSSARVHL